MKMKKFMSMLLVLSMSLSLSVPAFAAESNEVWDELEGRADTKVTLEVVNDCDHTDLRYINNGDGTHRVVCGDCDEVITEREDHVDANGDGACDKCDQECEHTGTHYVDNADGKTHKKICDKCGNVLVEIEDHIDTDDDKECDKCGALMLNQGPVLIATVPMKLPMVMDQKGNVTVSTSAEIQNHVADKAIAVTGIQATAKGGWTLANMNQDLKSLPKGTKLLAMSFRGDSHGTSGVFSLTSGNWNIAGGDALKLNMAAKIPGQSKAAETEVASVQFTLNWAGNANAATSSASTGAGDQAEINKSGNTTTTPTIPTDPDDDYALVRTIETWANMAADFTVSWQPTSATIQSVSSTNPSIATATVKSTGTGAAVLNISALKYGTANIIVTLSNGTKMKLVVEASDYDTDNIRVTVPTDKKVGDYLMPGDIVVMVPVLNADGTKEDATFTPNITPTQLTGSGTLSLNLKMTLNNGKTVNVPIEIKVSASDVVANVMPGVVVI